MSNVVYVLLLFFFFFKQKTAYEMRISDWSSDVCSSDLLPAIMLDHIAEQVGVDAGAIADFARRAPTRYDQLAAIKARFGFTDLSRPARGIMMTWLEIEAMPIVDGRILLDRLLDELRTRRIVIPGISVVER